MILNELQRKIGGRAASLDRAMLVAAAERQRQALASELEAAVQSARAELVNAGSAEAAFAPAHQLRQLAACAGRPSTGLLAHYLAAYLAYCADNGRETSQDIVAPLVRAIDQSLGAQEGDPLLAAIVEEGHRLIRRLGIVA